MSACFVSLDACFGGSAGAVCQGCLSCFVAFVVSASAVPVADLTESRLEVFGDSKQIEQVGDVEFDPNDSQSQRTKLQWKSMLVCGAYAAAVLVTVV